MKFLESTNFFVRTVMFDFTNRAKDINLEFRLVPMIHIGSEEFYKSVIENLKDCDEIFYEGVSLHKKKESFYERKRLKNLDLIFKQYKTIAEKLGLVTQSEYFDLSELESKLIHTDYNIESGNQAWQALSLKEKLKLNIIYPMALFISHQGISRKKLAKQFMTSREEAYLAYGPIEDEKGTATNFIMDKREQIIYKNIRDKIKSEGHVKKTIGIVYGAGHMKSIARYLIDYWNYAPKNGKFIKVFDLK